MKSAILSTLVLASCGVIEALPSPFTGGVRIALNNQKPADEETKDVFVPPEDWPISPGHFQVPLHTSPSSPTRAYLTPLFVSKQTLEKGTSPTTGKRAASKTPNPNPSLPLAGRVSNPGP